MFGDLERSECLTTAACHQEFATIGRLESSDHCRNGCLLMLTEALLFFEDRFASDLKPRPIDLTIFQIAAGDFDYWSSLTLECFVCIVGPVIGGGDDDSVCEGFLARGGEETVNVALRDAVVPPIVLALDGMKITGASNLRDEVDACVLAGYPLN